MLGFRTKGKRSLITGRLGNGGCGTQKPIPNYKMAIESAWPLDSKL